MLRPVTLAVALSLSLAACSATQMTGLTSLGTAIGQILPIIAGAIGVAPPVLTAASKAACASQAALNAAGHLAVVAGNNNLAGALSGMSAIAGGACTW